MKCTYCSTALRPIFSSATLRCDRCGAVHHADGTVISPRMLPLTNDERVSPWMFAHTRPIEHGLYECRFSNLGVNLMLDWNGAQFLAGGRPVRCATLVSWRGQWEK